MGSISCQVTSIVINSLGGGHTHANTHTHTHTQTSAQKQFKNPGAPAYGQHMPGLIRE